MTTYEIAVFRGDGIGGEVMAAAEAALAVLAKRHGLKLDLVHHDAGAAYYRETGRDMAADALDAIGRAQAILLGAMGLPDVRYPDGTEIAPHLKMRTAFGLYAGVRPVRRYRNTPSPLRAAEAEALDFVILRESTQGLFASRGQGCLVDDLVATETMVITRPTSEKLFDFAFRLARRRRAQGRGTGLVTCVDKSNVFVSMAFFRRIFGERAKLHPDVAADCAYVDAAALDLVRQPWRFDVMVMENMFADILSDLGGGLAGGMGMAPCAEIGDAHALFQPAHGSAPDIAGKGVANPTAMLVSAAMMLDWLGERHGDPKLVEAADALDGAVCRAYADAAVLPRELGGRSDCREVTEAVLERLRGGPA